MLLLWLYRHTSSLRQCWLTTPRWAADSHLNGVSQPHLGGNLAGCLDYFVWVHPLRKALVQQRICTVMVSTEATASTASLCHNRYTLLDTPDAPVEI